MKARCVSSANSTIPEPWTPVEAPVRSKVGGVGGGARMGHHSSSEHRRRSPPADTPNTPLRTSRARNGPVDSGPVPSLPIPQYPRHAHSQTSPPPSHSSIRASLAFRRDSPIGCFENATAAPSDIELPTVSPRAARARRRLPLRNNDPATPGPPPCNTRSVTLQRPVHLKRPGTFSFHGTTNASSDWRLPPR